MPLYEMTRDALIKVDRTTMQEQDFRERQDLQRLLKENLDAIEPDLMLLKEEFSFWEDSHRRIDLLALDRSGALVVIELKRSEDGGQMELQALRYASMVSTLGLSQAADAYASWTGLEAFEAEDKILTFIGSASEDFAHRVRIVLVAADFSKELTTSVLWLNSSGLDIRCIRLRPYKLESRTLLEVDQIIPIREAQEYTVKLKQKEAEVREARESNADYTRYDLTVNGQTYPNLTKRGLAWQVVSHAAKAGIALETLRKIVRSKRLIVVEGDLKGEAFVEAAKKERAMEDYVFHSTRWFIDDERLIKLDGNTLALSNQWAIQKLPLLENIIEAVPQAGMAYRSASGAME